MEAGGCVIGLTLDVLGDLLDEEVLGPEDESICNAGILKISVLNKG